MLFIIVHQVYELWFKELLHELTFLQRSLEAGHTGPRLGDSQTLLTILKTVVAQVDVLETLTPTQFLAFRSRLEAASGFESAQFRALEAALGVHGNSNQAARPSSTPSCVICPGRYTVPEERSSAATQEVLVSVYRDDVRLPRSRSAC